MNKTIKEWVDIAEYDMDTARAMMDAGRYLYVAFMCQQSAEKMLKAVYAHKRKEIPPRTHNLLYLVEASGISISESNAGLLAHLNYFYLESRYPGERNKLAEEIDKGKAKSTLKETQRLIKWLKQILR